MTTFESHFCINLHLSIIQITKNTMDFNTISLPDSLQEHVLTKDILFFREISSLEPLADMGQIEALAILIIKKGKLTFNAPDNQLTARKHDMLTLPMSLIKNCDTSHGSFECSLMAFSKDFVFSILSNTRIKWSNLENAKTIKPLYHLDEDILQIMSDYHKLFHHRSILQNSSKYIHATSTLAISMLADLTEYIKGTNPNTFAENTEPVRQSDVIFKRFIALIIETIADNNLPSRSIQFYADKLNVSPKYLTHVCKTCSGETAKSIIGRMLEKRISHLLMHSDLSIKEIAMNLGFPDVSNFGRYVKAIFGKSPRAIRASLKN